MSPNDVVTITFTNPDDPRSHAVPYEAVDKVVQRLKEVLDQAASTLFTPVTRPPFGAVLVGSPRAGSLEIILQFPLLSELQANTPVAKDLLALASSSIDGISDLAGIGSFILAVIFTPWGFLAKATRQDKPPSADPVEVFSAEQAQRLQMSMAESAKALIDAAYASNMAVDVEFRDGGRIRLNPANYKRTGHFIGQQAPGSKRPDMAGEVVVKTTKGPRIHYDRQVYTACLGRVDRGQNVVLLRFENSPLEKGKLTVKGSWVEDLSKLNPAGDLPDEFGSAAGVFVVSNFAVWKS